MTYGIRMVAQLDDGTRVYVVPTPFRECNVFARPDGTFRCSTHKHLQFCGGPERLRTHLNARPQPTPPRAA